MGQEKKFCHFCGTNLIKKKCEGRLRLFCTQCNEPIYENPTPATSIVLIDNTGKLLLVKRSVEPKKGFWCLPGGFIELGEMPGKAALRELKEETGLSGKIDILIGATSSHSNMYNSTILILCYLVKDYNGQLIAGDDAQDAAFFSYSQLPEIAFDSHEEFIQFYYAAHSNKKRGLILTAPTGRCIGA